METKKNPTCLGNFLERPTYPFVSNGSFYRPSHREIFNEFFKRLNVFANIKNWLPAWGWFMACVYAVFFFVFLFKFFTWPLFFIGMLYSMVVLGSHGTLYLHRYATHRAYKFSNSAACFIVRNLVPKVIPEEIYVVSHHVHHQMSEKPGDPYNVNGGFLYCFLADVNHQLVNRNLTEAEYTHMTKLVTHTGMVPNTYAQYLKYGSLANPARTIFHYLALLAFWYGMFYLIGGHALAFAILGCSAIWAFGVRTFNYDGHGRGKDRRRDGIDFNRRDWSVNQVWPGYVAGEWHNNHHLYANGARSGFLPYQIDLPWYFIKFYKAIGGISSYKDYKEEFLTKYYRPYIDGKLTKEALDKEGLIHEGETYRV